MLNRFQAAIFAVALAIGGTAQATTIDFNDQLLGTATYGSVVRSIAYNLGNGVIVTTHGESWVSAGFHNANPAYPSNGTGFLMIKPGADITVTKADNSLFSVSSLDLASWYSYTKSTATLTGTRWDGTIEVASYSIVQPNYTFYSDDYATETLSGFTGLKSFKISASDDYLDVDNIVLGAAPAAKVPEPAALGIVGLGLAGLAFARRRKQ